MAPRIEPVLARIEPVLPRIEPVLARVEPVLARIEPVPEPVIVASAVAILTGDPNLTAAQLAARAGVTLSYARSLIRRKKAKAQAQRAPKVVVRAPAELAVSDLQNEMRELARRVEQTETQAFQAATVATKPSCRIQVLDLRAAGIAIEAISSGLEIPVGETEFILKMDRLKKSVKH